jgi:hypothetical protein
MQAKEKRVQIQDSKIWILKKRKKCPGKVVKAQEVIDRQDL